MSLVSDNTSSPPPNTFISSSNGSLIPDVGAGAATVWFDSNRSSPPPQPNSSLKAINVRVWDANKTAPSQAELKGFQLAVAQSRVKAHQLTKFFWFFTDNQMVIRDLTEPLKPKAGMNSCIKVQNSLGKLLRRHPGAKISIIWCLLKVKILRMQQVDAAAKEAASL